MYAAACKETLEAYYGKRVRLVLEDGEEVNGLLREVGKNVAVACQSFLLSRYDFSDIVEVWICVVE